MKISNIWTPFAEINLRSEGNCFHVFTISRKFSRKLKKFLNSINKVFNFHSSKDENLIVLHCTKYAFCHRTPSIREQPRKEPTWIGLRFPPVYFSSIKHALKSCKSLDIYETKPTKRNKTFELNILSIFSKFEACMPADFTKLNSSMDVFKKKVKHVKLFFNKNQFLQNTFDWMLLIFRCCFNIGKAECLRKKLNEEDLRRGKNHFFFSFLFFFLLSLLNFFVSNFHFDRKGKAQSEIMSYININNTIFKMFKVT